MNEKEVKEEIKYKMDSICEFLKESTIKMRNDSSDGRINSLLSENNVTDKIIEEFDFCRDDDNNRGKDFELWLNSLQKYMEVNLKIVESTTLATNISGAEKFIMNMLWNPNAGSAQTKSIVKKIIEKEEYTEEYTDYILLVYYKDTGNCKWGSVSQINKNAIICNPANGFQLKLNDFYMEDRYLKEGRDFLLEKYINLLKKRAKPYLDLMEVDLV